MRLCNAAAWQIAFTVLLCTSGGVVAQAGSDVVFAPVSADGRESGELPDTPQSEAPESNDPESDDSDPDDSIEHGTQCAPHVSLIASQFGSRTERHDNPPGQRLIRPPIFDRRH